MGSTYWVARSLMCTSQIQSLFGAVRMRSSAGESRHDHKEMCDLGIRQRDVRYTGKYGEMSPDDAFFCCCCM